MYYYRETPLTNICFSISQIHLSNLVWLQVTVSSETLDGVVDLADGDLRKAVTALQVFYTTFSFSFYSWFIIIWCHICVRVYVYCEWLPVLLLKSIHQLYGRQGGDVSKSELAEVTGKIPPPAIEAVWEGIKSNVFWKLQVCSTHIRFVSELAY